MNICIFIDSLGSGGAQTQATNLAILLQKNYCVTVVTYHEKHNFLEDKLVQNKIEIQYINTKYFLGKPVSLVRILMERKIDVVISFLDVPNLYASLACFLTFRKIKLIVSYRSSTDFKKLTFLSKIIRPFVIKLANFVVFNSNHERLSWINHYFDSPKFITIYNGVDFQKWKYQNTVLSKKLYGIGSIGTDKNIDVIIKAIGYLKKQHVIIYMDWYGAVITKDQNRQNYYEKLVNLIHENDINDQWTWHPPLANIQDEVSIYSYLVLSSKVEGLPNVVCEALASGIPCIVSNILDNPILINESRGFLFDPNNFKDLSNTILKAINTCQEDYVTFKKNAYEFSQLELSPQNLVDSFKKLIEDK